MKLPVVSGAEVVKAFRKLSDELDEQHGSHMILRRADPPHRRLSVPIAANSPRGRYAS
jgi:predicted RNA binding protein YcfA (HicA-like mRNA interferase family)